MGVMTESEVDVRRADDGDVYRAHAPRLIALATVLAGPATAEDVVSAAVLKVIGSPGWSVVENQGAYLTRAVVNEVRSSHRSSLRREARERRTAPPASTT